MYLIIFPMHFTKCLIQLASQKIKMLFEKWEIILL